MFRRPLGRGVAAALVVAGAAAAFVLLVAAATRARDIPFFEVAGDPAIVGDGPFYAGALSNLGVLVWWTGACVCATIAALLRRTGATEGARALLLLAAVTAALALDDLFLVHEEIAPAVGVPQEAVVALHTIAAAAVLVLVRRAVPAAAWPMLAAAIAAFAVSVAWDLLPGDPTNLDRGVEDGAKFVGIACWTAFVVHVAWTSLPAARDGERPAAVAPDGAAGRPRAARRAG